MLNIHKEYLQETVGPDGVIVDYSFTVPEQFNFAYDVIDRIAAAEPDRRAMYWSNEAGESHTFTFGDMSRYSDMAASYFLQLGIRRGDKVMLILKRHYQFWFAILGLHKIGAAGIPATNQLHKKDLLYRFNAAGIRAVLCTAEGEVAEAVVEAAAEYGQPLILMMAKGARPGWNDFDAGIQSAPTFVRPSGDAAPVSGDVMLLYFTSGTHRHAQDGYA